MNGYKEKHGSSQSFPVASSAFSGYRGKHQQKNRRHRFWMVVLVILICACLAWPFVEAHLLTVERVSLISEDLPASVERLRIVYVSDIHYGFYYSNADLNRLVSQINQLIPDLVLFGGGYGTDYDTAIRFFQNLPSIHVRYEMFGVIGETDRLKAPEELSELQAAMKNAGIIPLINQVRQVRIADSAITIAGLDDPVSGTPDLRAISSAVSASDYVILLCHSPSVIPDTQLMTDGADRLGWYDLGLFGHTHGGQMAIFSSLLDLAGEVPDRYRSGWLKENRVDLLVSRGVGTSVIPARLFCMPQIHVIEVSRN